LNDLRRSSTQDGSNVPSRLDEVFRHLQRRSTK
jgi:hypothetical protein